MCNLWGRPKSPFNVREYRPGEHGQARRRKPSDFGLQLAAKQRLKGYYGNITEKQFRRTYEEATRRRGDTSEESNWPIGAQARCRGISHEICANCVRSPSIYKPRSHFG